MPVFWTVDIPLGSSYPSIEQMVLWTMNGDVARMGRLLWFIPLVLILALIDAILRAVALRRAGNHKQLPRFICLLIFSTCGILPLVYLIWFQKEEK
jgi:uncharacterized membrane protein YadS